MKLITEKYTIEYIDAYVNGIEVNWFKVTINGVVIDIEYSKERKEIISYGVDTDSRVIESNERDGEDVTYVYAEAEALQCFKYAMYEIKNVCNFMMDLI